MNGYWPPYCAGRDRTECAANSSGAAKLSGALVAGWTFTRIVGVMTGIDVALPAASSSMLAHNRCAAVDGGWAVKGVVAQATPPSVQVEPRASCPSEVDGSSSKRHQIASGEKIPEGQIVFAAGGSQQNKDSSTHVLEHAVSVGGVNMCAVGPPHGDALLCACDVAAVMRGEAGEARLHHARTCDRHR